MKKVLCLALLLLLTSCATKISQSGLYWGNYSETLYAYKKNPSAENLLKHKNELLSIIAKSKELKLRPPPGIQIELGVIYSEEKNQKLAMENFVSEKSTYPESEFFTAKILDIFTDKKVGKQ